MEFYASSSGALAVGTTVVCARGAVLLSMDIQPAAAASSITLYDNASTGSGKVLAIVQATASGQSIHLDLAYPLQAINGITAVVAGAAATGVVRFSPL